MTRQVLKIGEDRIRTEPRVVRISPSASCHRLLRWLARLACRWANARSLLYVEDDVHEHEWVEIPSAMDVVERLHLSAGDHELLWGRRARYVLVGPDVAHELHGAIRARATSLGSVELCRWDDGKLTALGVEVVYVPWMDGVLLAPEWMDEVEAKK